MKATILFIFLALLTIINSQLSQFTTKKCSEYYNKQETNYQAYSKDFCRTLKLEYGSKCCFLKYTFNERTYYNCAELNLNQFVDIDKGKNEISKEGWNIKSLECDSSSYLYGSLLLLLVLVF